MAGSSRSWSPSASTHVEPHDALSWATNFGPNDGLDIQPVYGFPKPVRVRLECRLSSMCQVHIHRHSAVNLGPQAKLACGQKRESMSQVESAIELQSEALCSKLPLTEIRVVGQFRDDVDRDEMLRVLADIVGGVSCARTVGGEVISACASSQQMVAEVRRAFREYSNRTSHGFLWVDSRREGAGITLPKYCNPDPRGNRARLFPGQQRRRVLASLKRKLGLPQVYNSHGLWVNGQGELISDPNEVLVFPAGDARVGDAIEAIRSDVLAHPACDQECIFLTCGGRAACVYRADEGVGAETAVAS